MPDQRLDRDGKLQKVKELMLSVVPADGSSIGNVALRRKLEAWLAAEDLSLSEEEYWQAYSAAFRPV